MTMMLQLFRLVRVQRRNGVVAAINTIESTTPLVMIVIAMVRILVTLIPTRYQAVARIAKPLTVNQRRRIMVPNGRRQTITSQLKAITSSRLPTITSLLTLLLSNGQQVNQVRHKATIQVNRVVVSRNQLSHPRKKINKKGLLSFSTVL